LDTKYLEEIKGKIHILQEKEKMSAGGILTPIELARL
jgi:hypothetical protein